MKSTKLTRRAAMKAGGTGLAAATLLGSGALRAQAAADGKILFVIGASGGGNITDCLLPISTAEAGGGIRAFEPAQIVQPNGSNFRTVIPLENSVQGVIGLGNGYAMSSFVGKVRDDLVVMTQECTSVNHLVASKRSVNGAGINRGRTLQEEMAMRYGQGLVLPNASMSGGYGDPGDDPTVPAYARPEPISDARLFAFATDGSKGVAGAPNMQLVDRARRVRKALELRSPFGQTFARAPIVRNYLVQRDELAPRMRDAQLIKKLMMLTSTPGGAPISQYDLETSPSGAQLLEKFPQMLIDPLDAQAALAFLLARYQVSCAITFGPGTSPVFESTEQLLQPPLSFDWSHNDHVGAQNSMWGRIFKTLDGLIDLLKTTDYGDNPANGKMWDRSLIYIATEFGREKSGNSTGHHLNNGNVLISPLLKGNKVYGGVDASTGLTYGFDRQTGAPTPGAHMAEGDVYSAIAHALDIPFAGRRDFPCMVRNG